MNLNEVISSVAIKQLVDVDLPESTSNQHELNGVTALRSFFKTNQKILLPIKWSFFNNDSLVVSQESVVTFYDAREKSHLRTGRSEWRMYYKGRFLSHAQPGDILFLVKTSVGQIYGLIFPLGSSWLRAAENLFGNIEYQTSFNLFPAEQIGHREFGFFEQRILDELGIDVQYPVIKGIDKYIEKAETFATAINQDYPPTRVMASLAREFFFNTERISCIESPDNALIKLLDKETELFKALEKRKVEERLRVQVNDVDDFTSYALSVLNRRKSRMGQSLQNHLEYVFHENGLLFESQKITEGKNRPDFIFPSIHSYRDLSFPSTMLRMLAAKSTVKERWHQILSEAARIQQKHLCTLDRSISNDQFNEMLRENVVLVLPEKIRCLYPAKVVSASENIGMFIKEIKTIQNN